MEENKVVYRFDVDFSGAASTAPVINIASTDLNSRMFVMTPKNGSETLVLSDTVNPVLVLTKTQNGKTEIVETITCLYINGKIVADVPIIDSAYTSLEGTVIFYEYNNTAKMFKLQSAPFKVSVVSSAESSGTVTAADEFKAFVDALAKADSLCKVVYASSSDADNMNVNLKSADCLDKIIWVSPPNSLAAETGNPLKINFTDGKTKNIVCSRDGNSYTTNIPRKYINSNRPMALWVDVTYAMWINCPTESINELPTSTTLPSVLAAGKHYKLTVTAAFTLTLPDSANNGDVIEVEYFNSGTASIRVQWCTVSSANTPTSAPILSNNLGTGSYATCGSGTLHRARCIWSDLAGKWTVDIELFGIKTK